MYIELSYPISEDIPVYPDSPHEVFANHLSMDAGDDVNASIITHFMHNGTHVDAPLHFFNKGQSIDEIPIDNFIYEKPIVIQKKMGKSGLLTVDDLKSMDDDIGMADILLFNTGYCSLRGDAAVYVDDFPALSESAAKYIRTELLNVKAVAIDTLSIESATQGPAHNFRVHKILLDGELYDTRPLLIF